jgi:hypothetical protein
MALTVTSPYGGHTRRARRIGIRRKDTVMSLVSQDLEVDSEHPSQDATKRRSHALADRLEQGARALASLASELTDAEWQTAIPRDGRTIGVIVHHVASVYPIEIQLAQVIATGRSMTGVTMNDVHAMNAAHARDHARATKAEALDLLRRNSAAAAAAIRALSDDELDHAAPASLYSEAPVTCQFVLEDHAVRHSYHHLMKIKGVLER